MKPGWAYIGKNKAKRPFERWEELKKGRVRIFLHDKKVIVDREAIVIWPESGEDASQSINSKQGRANHV